VKPRISPSAAYIAYATAASKWDSRISALVPDQAARISEWFVEAVYANGRARLGQLRRPVWRALLGIAERLFIPRLRTTYAVRKRWIEELVRDGLKGGFGQCAVLGAGFDTLAARLHCEFPGVDFIEIDLPEIVQVKEQVLRKRGFPLPNLRFAGVDLSHDWMGALSDAKATVLVAEGLLMYLPPEAVDRLFRGLGGRTAASRIIFTFVESARPKSWRDRFRRGREPYLWTFPRDRLNEFLVERGWRIRSLVPRNELWGRFFPEVRSQPAGRGEHLCVADAG
jgi:methyltransferase (TIGR00027 family)